MKKIPILSINDFYSYCKTLSPNHIIFSYENQDWLTTQNTLKIKVIFDELRIRFNPNVIYLTSGSNMISFDRVKYIEKYESSPIGEVFGIVCGEASSDNNTTYIIVIRKK